MRILCVNRPHSRIAVSHSRCFLLLTNSPAQSGIRSTPSWNPSSKLARHIVSRRSTKPVSNPALASSGIFIRSTKKTLQPAQWCYLPGLYEVIHLPVFSIVVNAADDVDVEAIHFKDAADVLPGFAVSWVAARKTQLAQLVDQARTSGSASGKQDGPASSDTMSLDLATTVFKCAQRSCSGLLSARKQDNTLIGWEAAAAHHCRDDGHAYLARNSNILLETILEFSVSGSTAAFTTMLKTGR